MPDIYGLSYKDSVYVHYKKEHFNWHKTSSPDFDFSNAENHYRKLTMENYKRYAAEARAKELKELQKNQNAATEVISALATFSQENLPSALNSIMKSIQIVNNENAGNNRKMDSVSFTLDKLGTLVKQLSMINTTITDYLAQGGNINFPHLNNLNLLVVNKESLYALNRVKDTLVAIKAGMIKKSGGNFAVSYKGKTVPVSLALVHVKNEFEKIVNDFGRISATVAVNEVIKSLDRTNINGTVINVQGIDVEMPNGKIAKVKSNGDIEINLGVPAFKQNNQTTKLMLKNESVKLQNYLHQIKWQARYLMFNGLLHKNYNTIKPFYQYIASRALPTLVSRHSVGNNFIFLEASNQLISIGEFYETILNTNNFPSLATEGSTLIPNSWVGRMPRVAVLDDYDEIRNHFAWKRAIYINKMIQNLSTRITFAKK